MLRWLAELAGGSAKRVAIPRHDPVITLEGDQAQRYLRRVKGAVELLRGEFVVRETKGRAHRELDSDVRRFGAAGNPKNLRVLDGYELSKPDFTGHWFTFAYFEEGGGSHTRYGGDFIRQGVVVNVPFNAGDVFIRPENFRDLVSEWFEGIEIDFPEHPRFCRKYFVLAADEAHLRKALPDEVLDILAQTSGLFIRLRGQHALVAVDRIVRAKDALRLVEIAAAFAESK